jgi:hypothetical protein
VLGAVLLECFNQLRGRLQETKPRVRTLLYEEIKRRIQPCVGSKNCQGAKVIDEVKGRLQETRQNISRRLEKGVSRAHAK